MRLSGGGTGAVDVNTHNSKPLVSGKQVPGMSAQSYAHSAAHTQSPAVVKEARATDTFGKMLESRATHTHTQKAGGRGTTNGEIGNPLLYPFWYRVCFLIIISS